MAATSSPTSSCTAQRPAIHSRDAPSSSLELGERRFDVAFAVRVGLLHREPQRARALVEPWLADGGRLVVSFDAPG